MVEELRRGQTIHYASLQDGHRADCVANAHFKARITIANSLDHKLQLRSEVFKSLYRVKNATWVIACNWNPGLDVFNQASQLLLGEETISHLILGH